MKFDGDRFHGVRKNQSGGFGIGAPAEVQLVGDAFGHHGNVTQQREPDIATCASQAVEEIEDRFEGFLVGGVYGKFIELDFDFRK